MRDSKKILTSDRAKKIYIALALLVVLFFVCNDILMPWYVNQRGVVEVPPVVGLTFDDATRVLDSLGLEARKGDTRPDKDHPAGTVIIQNPQAGDRVKKNRRMYLTLSGGEQLVGVPTLKGKTLRDAKFALEREGLKLGAIAYEPSEEFPPQTVMGQSLPPNSKAKRDDYVSVVISQGRIAERVALPDLVGKTLAAAEKILIENGLKVGNITHLPSADLLPNTVIDQFPRVGELVPIGQAVDLFVVQGGEKKKGILEN